MSVGGATWRKPGTGPRGRPKWASPLRAMMAAKDLRVEDVCAISGLSRHGMNKLLRSDPSVPVEWVLRAAYALGCRPAELFPGLDWRPSRPVRLAREAVQAALDGDELVIARNGAPAQVEPEPPVG